MTLLSLTAESYAHDDPEADGFCIQLTVLGFVIFLGFAR